MKKISVCIVVQKKPKIEPPKKKNKKNRKNSWPILLSTRAAKEKLSVEAGSGFKKVSKGNSFAVLVLQATFHHKAQRNKGISETHWCEKISFPH